MSNNDFELQTHTSENLDRLAQFIRRYKKTYPDAKLKTAEFYTYHPALANSQNVWCVLDAAQRVCAFAPLFPAPLPAGSPEMEGGAPSPHHIWTILLADPEMPNAADVRQLLYGCVLEQARNLQASFPDDRRVRLAADMIVCQQPDIAFLKTKGFGQYDGMFVMRRSMEEPVPEQRLAQRLTLRRSKLASEQEQVQYLQAFNCCFPELPKDLEALRFLLDSQKWLNGTAVAAFDRQGVLVASILVYPDEGNKYWILDDVFVLPGWRGQGIAKALVAEGLLTCQPQGCLEVFLEVRQHNISAVSVYRRMGFETVNEEVLLGLFL